MILRVLVYLAVGFGLLASTFVAPSLWGLAGITALLFSLRILAFWFLGSDGLYSSLDAEFRDMLSPLERIVAIATDLL